MRAGTARYGRFATAVVVSALLAACASNGSSRAPERSPQAAVPPAADEPPRSDRGNPPFYDVLGKRYHVLPTSRGYRQRGVASWYGRDFHGLSTSSGEPYDMFAMTAAHTTLPLPTWVEVTNLVNGKHVVVKVNDRGPFVDNRLIDLSFAAATQLDMVRNGTTRVEVRAIPPPPFATVTAAAAVSTTESAAGAVPQLAAAAVQPPLASSASPSPPPGPQMFVQVGAFSDRANAARLVERLRASGFSNPFVASENGGRRSMHRVRLGPIRDAEEFDQVSARLRALGLADARLVTGSRQ